MWNCQIDRNYYLLTASRNKLWNSVLDEFDGKILSVLSRTAILFQTFICGKSYIWGGRYREWRRYSEEVIFAIILKTSLQWSAEIFYSFQDGSWLSEVYFCLLSWYKGLLSGLLLALGGWLLEEQEYAGCRGYGWEDQCHHTCPGGLYLFQRC